MYLVSTTSGEKKKRDDEQEHEYCSPSSRSPGIRPACCLISLFAHTVHAN